MKDPDPQLQQMDDALAGMDHPAQRLREALDKDELELYCQPIAALQGAVRFPMAEVLIRMREEEQALLPPGEFLPVFEHYRLMVSVRMMQPDTEGRLRPSTADAAFELTLCA